MLVSETALDDEAITLLLVMEELSPNELPNDNNYYQENITPKESIPLKWLPLLI